MKISKLLINPPDWLAVPLAVALGGVFLAAAVILKSIFNP